MAMAMALALAMAMAMALAKHCPSGHTPMPGGR
jgi:hypothetical protein